MNELIPIQNLPTAGLKNNVVDARDLYMFLESNRNFGNWIKQRINKYQFRENFDFFTFNEKSTGARGRIKRGYFITLDMAKELAMVENNEKGREARRYFIEVEKRFRARESLQVPPELPPAESSENHNNYAPLQVHLERKSLLETIVNLENEIIHWRHQYNLAFAYQNLLRERLSKATARIEELEKQADGSKKLLK